MPLIPPDLSATLTIAILSIMGAAWLLWMVPSCGDPECRKTHERHTIADRAKDIERQHITYHDPLRPQPACSLCQRKRDPES